MVGAVPVGFYDRDADYPTWDDTDEDGISNRHEVLVAQHIDDDPNNPFERILGSTALTAVPDNIIVLESDGGRSILHTRGRLITQQKDIFELHGNEFAICQNAGAELAGIADVQSKILDYLGTNGPATQTQIAMELGLQKSNVSRYVKRLAAKGRVQGGGRNKPVELVGDHAMI